MCKSIKYEWVWILLWAGLMLITERVWAASPNILINEIMANPVHEATGEFIEIYNSSDTPIDISGWRLTDPGDVNDILVDYVGPYDMGHPGTIIPAQGYALIVDPDYDGIYNDWIATHVDLSHLIIITIEGDRTLGNGLGNSKDAILIDGGTGNISRYEWVTDAGGNGVSWEKIHLNGGDQASNWAPSHYQGTPGGPNSVTPVTRDAKVDAEFLMIDPVIPSINETVTVLAYIHNNGLSPLTDINVAFFIDADQDSVIDLGEEISTIAVAGDLSPGDSVWVVGRWQAENPGKAQLGVVVIVPDDLRMQNNTAFIEIQIQYPPQTLIINEIMFNPADGPEWLELYNGSTYAVDLEGWTIETADSTKSRLITNETVQMQPDQYMVLSSDTLAFQERFSINSLSLRRPEGGWPSLLNQGTRITLRDPTTQVINQVDYKAEWGTGPGRSIERIHPIQPSKSVGWGPSTHEAGGTPGQRNSLSVETLPDQLTMDIHPNPFSPDGDGIEDETNITLELPVAHGIARMFIYDITGRHRRTLLDGEPVATQQILAWNGLDDKGIPLHIGPYILYFEMIEPTTGQIQKLKKLIVLAKRL